MTLQKALVDEIEETFQASDGYRFHVQRFLPSSAQPSALTPAAESPAVKALIVCLHGIQSHSGWYLGSCRHLASAGYEVAFLDRRGSGKNQQARGDTPSYSRLIQDVVEFLHHEQSRDPERITVFLAISWGGKVATEVLRRHPQLARGLVLLCPGFFPQIRPAWRTRLAIVLTRLTRPSKRFPIPLNDPELFTTTPRWLEFLHADPLALHEATARFLVESVRLDRSLQKIRRTPGQIQVPCLLMLAGRDRIIDNAQTRAFVEQFSSPGRNDLKVIEYPEAQHTLEFEPDTTVFLKDLTGWLERLSQPNPPEV